jgi:hypothetical protein
MAQPNTIRVELEPAVAESLAAWGEDEGRSKRGHAAYLLRKLATLRQTNPGELARLGLMVTPTATPAADQGRAA